MGIYVTMPIDTADARALLRVPPDKYVEERTRLAKQAKADKDRPLAEFYQSLKRPALSLWAVLAAGDDAKAVNEVVSITSKLGETQAGAGTATAVSAATKDRRKAIEGLVDRAIKALAADDKSAEARRAEIREIVDQLSRHPELAESWIDGTLRELPEEEFGFGAFDVVAMPASPPKPKEATPKAGKPKVARADDDASERVPTRAERAAKAEATKQARKDVSDAARAVSDAERRVRSAEAEVRKAEKTLREAEAALDNANRRHAAAVTHADAL
ncbi:MAG TPA: hypothetical protein VIK05_06170 [Ilumatobacteraceae bacterium]